MKTSAIVEMKFRGDHAGWRCGRLAYFATVAEAASTE